MKPSEFKFLGYRVTKFKLEISNSFESKHEKLQHDISVGHGFDKELEKFVEITIKVNVKSESVNINLVICGGFQASPQVPDDVFETLCKQNGPAILFPYARSYITTATVQANIPPIILPTVNLIQSNGVDKKKVSDKG